MHFEEMHEDIANHDAHIWDEGFEAGRQAEISNHMGTMKERELELEHCRDSQGDNAGFELHLEE